MRLIAVLMWSMAIVLMVTACGTQSYARGEDLRANLPRGIGLGAFAPGCIFICVVTANFSHGGGDVVEDLQSMPESAGQIRGRSATRVLRRKGSKP